MGHPHHPTARLVRASLLPGINAVMSACGPREIEQVYALLPGGALGAPRALFKQLNDDFTKHHKYTGKN